MVRYKYFWTGENVWTTPVDPSWKWKASKKVWHRVAFQVDYFADISDCVTDKYLNDEMLEE